MRRNVSVISPTRFDHDSLPRSSKHKGTAMLSEHTFAFPYSDQFGKRLAHDGDALSLVVILTAVVVGTTLTGTASAAELWAGAAKVDITNLDAGPVQGRMYAKAIVLSDGTTTAAIVTLDVVSLGEIGHIKNDFLGKVRSRFEKELGIKPANVLVNTSHCHGVPCSDVEERTFRAVKNASQKLVPVKVGVGTGHEDRIMENRRLKLKNGKEVDVRHAYSMPPDEEVASVGPIDPEIGVIRLDKRNGQTLAAVYNFAMHPILGVNGNGHTSDVTGFASQVIEDNLSDGAIAVFLQGCAGDINPVYYKDVNHPRHAETLGNMLGLSTLKALRKVETKNDGRLKIANEVIQLPRADYAERIHAMESRQLQLLRSLRGTSLNLKTFIPLVVKYNMHNEFPSYYSHKYLHDKALGRDDLYKLDAENRRNMKQYIRNIRTMEQLTRLNANLALLRKHQADMLTAGKRTIDVELLGFRIGDCVLLTFPGELTVRIGINIKKRSPHEFTFVAGYTNGYIYYAPTAEQLRNVGGAQEDSDCVLAPLWQKLYEDKAAEMLGRL